MRSNEENESKPREYTDVYIMHNFLPNAQFKSTLHQNSLNRSLPRFRGVADIPEGKIACVRHCTSSQCTPDF